MMRPAYIKQPGPALEPRIYAVECRGRAFEIDVLPGEKLLDGMLRGFSVEGFVSGTIDIASLELEPFAYVMPALSTTGENAAFYSNTFRPAGVTRLTRGAMTLGTRDGLAFFHAHAVWREADGRRSGGHILPDDTRVASQCRVMAYGVDGVRFDAKPDPETNFKLLGPIAEPVHDADTDTRALAVRLRPNQDFVGAIEAACAAHGIQHARIRGGVGSLIGAHFADGTVIENFATEVYLAGGTVRRTATGAYVTVVEAGLVDFTGVLAEGQLVKGLNPVLMTFELVLEVLEPQ